MSFEEREAISRINILTNPNIKLLNDYLIGNDILNYFKVRQKLISLPYERILELKKLTRNNDSTVQLHNLLENIVSELEAKSILLFSEDILINNVPLLVDSPFYGEESNDLRITDLKPYAEYLYFSNLRLEHHKNDLMQQTETDRFWKNKTSINVRVKESINLPGIANRLQFDKLAETASEIYTYSLKDDNLSDFIFESRQWIKKYEEGQLYPVVYEDKVLLRNEHRLFCLDASSGKEIWSFDNLDSSGYEFYQTLRHPHHNSFGYELLLDNDVVFTELDGKFIAVKITDKLAPQLIWKRNLGEYTVCTKPIKKENLVIAGLINARMELWICGFNSQTGDLEWNTYIGSGSLLSPVCTVSAIGDDRIYIGTNHGVLICLNPDDGEIFWLREYTPKQYSVFDFWLKRYYLDFLSNKGSINFDTQFVELGSDGFLYYKPRDSDYVYILQSDGELKEEILIDPQWYYILRVNAGKLYLLERKENDPQLKVVELQSGRQVYTKVIDCGPLQGVNYINREDMSFKLGDLVYFLRVQEEKINVVKMTMPVKGWLLDTYGHFIFIGRDKTIFCLDAYDIKKNSYIKNNLANFQFLQKRENLKNNFIRATKLDIESKETKELRSQILKELSAGYFSLEETLPIIINNPETLKHPAWKEIFIKLQELYGDKVISFRDIEIKFSNFLWEAGLVDPAFINNQKYVIKKQVYTSDRKNFNIRGEGIDVLPVNVIDNPEKHLVFFLLLKYDQLICIDEDGRIRWHSKLFFKPIWKLYSFGDANIDKEHLYRANIEAYLYKNVLIVNDHINIVARDINDGSYIWSMTSKGKILEQEKIYLSDPDSLSGKNDFIRSYLKNIMLFTRFLDGRIVVSHGNKIYSLNPVTGFCDRYRELDIEGMMKVYISDGHIYILSYFLDKVMMLNNRFDLVDVFSLDFIERALRKSVFRRLAQIQKRICANLCKISFFRDLIENKAGYAELVFVKDNILIHTNSNLYVMDKTGKLKDRLKIDNKRQFYVEAYKDDILIIFPFEGITSYRLERDALRTNWQFELESCEHDVLWEKEYSDNSKYYFIIGDQILISFRKKCDYFMTSIDLKAGRKIWESNLTGVQGLFYRLSNYQNINQMVNFIISTCCSEICDDENHFCAKSKYVSINSILFRINLTSGELLKTEKMVQIGSNVFKDCTLNQTENYFIYSIYKKLLNATLKRN